MSLPVNNNTLNFSPALSAAPWSMSICENPNINCQTITDPN
jgi:hypothetical protein